MYNYYGLDTSLAPWLGGPISSSDTSVNRVGWMMESLVIDPVSTYCTIQVASPQLTIYNSSIATIGSMELELLFSEATIFYDGTLFTMVSLL